MDLSDARHNINSLVTCGAKVEYDEELWDLSSKSWRLIHEELNYAEDKRRLDHLEKERRATRAWMRPD